MFTVNVTDLNHHLKLPVLLNPALLLINVRIHISIPLSSTATSLFSLIHSTLSQNSSHILSCFIPLFFFLISAQPFSSYSLCLPSTFAIPINILHTTPLPTSPILRHPDLPPSCSSPQARRRYLSTLKVVSRLFSSVFSLVRSKHNHPKATSPDFEVHIDNEIRKWDREMMHCVNGDCSNDGMGVYISEEVYV